MLKGTTCIDIKKEIENGVPLLYAINPVVLKISNFDFIQFFNYFFATSLLSNLKTSLCMPKLKFVTGKLKEPNGIV